MIRAGAYQMEMTIKHSNNVLNVWWTRMMDHIFVSLFLWSVKYDFSWRHCRRLQTSCLSNNGRKTSGWWICAITVYWSQTLFREGTSRQKVVEKIWNALTQKPSNQDKTLLPGITRRRISQTVKKQLVQDTTLNKCGSWGFSLESRKRLIISHHS